MRVEVMDEPPNPQPRWGWLLRQRPDEGLWCVHMHDVHGELVETSRLKVDLEPIEKLDPPDQEFERELPALIDEHADASEAFLELRAVDARTAWIPTHYLLDTSAMRKFPGSVLREWSAKAVFVYSWYSAMELISQLDTASERDFPHVRASLLKTRHMRYVGDPHEVFVAAAKIGERPEIDHQETIADVLALLEDSKDFETFRMRAAHKSRRDLIALPSSVRQCFDRTEEVEHRAFTERLIAALGRLTKEELEDDATMFNIIVAKYIDGEAQNARDRGAHAAGLEHRLKNALYIHFAYVVVRARNYLNRPGSIVDGNDFVDAGVCRHLNLNIPCVLITGDDGQHTAVKEALGVLRRADFGFRTRVVRCPERGSEWPSWLEKLMAEG